MKKIPEYLESPIDNLIYFTLIEKVAPTFYSFGFTPNMITTLGNIATCLSAYALYNDLYMISAMLFIISYIFDCLDGYIARRYDLVSKFGDLYDHTSDLIKIILISYILYKKNSTLFIATIPLIVILGVLMSSFLAYQEKLYDKSQSSYTLSLLSNLCFVKSDQRTVIRHMEYVKYFGCGTFTAVMAIIIALYYPK